MGEAKRKQQQICPAWGRTISRSDCAGGRNSAIDCPTTCRLNPLAPVNYREQFMAAEGHVIGCLERSAVPEMTSEVRQQLIRAMRSGDSHAANELITPIIHAPGAIQRWQAAGCFDDFRNDEQVILQCMKTLRAGLLEIQSRVDEVSAMARDLLRPDEGEHLVIDSSTAGRASRFRTYLTRYYLLPTGWRILGSAVEVPAMLPRGPRQVLDHVMDHYEAPQGDRDKWAFEHLNVLMATIGYTAQARRHPHLAKPSLLVPAALLENPDWADSPSPPPPPAKATAAEMATAFRACYEGFIDRPLPVLGRVSPREAASDPDLRPILLRLMKHHAVHCDNERLRGVDVDINDVIEELGLSELQRPPGPLGAFG